jgi:hypothetical protein
MRRRSPPRPRHRRDFVLRHGFYDRRVQALAEVRASGVHDDTIATELLVGELAEAGRAIGADVQLRFGRIGSFGCTLDLPASHKGGSGSDQVVSPWDSNPKPRSRIRSYADIRGCPYLLFRVNLVSTNVRGYSLGFGPLAAKVAAD